jgi:hypothetical protein
LYNKVSIFFFIVAILSKKKRKEIFRSTKTNYNSKQATTASNAATKVFSYSPFAWAPPPPPLPLPEQKVTPQPAEKKSSGSLFGNLTNSIKTVVKDVEKGIKTFDNQIHLSIADPIFRSKFNLSPTEALVGDFKCRSVDAQGITLSARVLVYGLHLCFILTAPDNREAIVAIPLAQIVTWY